jgi:hypothetical protein
MVGDETVRRSSGRDGGATCRTALTGLIVTVALIVFCSLAFTAGFMEKDDVILADFASGVDSGRPSASLVFVGVIPGLVISTLHRIAPSIGWYAIALLATFALTQAAIGTVFWRLRQRLGPARSAAAFGIWVSATATFAVSLSFSPIAIMVAVGAVVLALSALLVKGVRRAIMLSAAVLTAFGAFQWRREAVVGVLLLFAPVLLVAMFRFGRRTSVLLLFALGVALALSVGLDKVPVGSDAWRQYNQFNDSRHQVSNTQMFVSVRDRRHDPEIEQALAEAGWTPDQVMLMAYWFFYDRDVYSGERMDRLRSVVSDHGRPAGIGEAATVRWHVGFTVVVAVLLSLRRIRRRWWWCMVGQAAWIIAVCAYVRATKRLPPHVSLPIAMGSALVLLIAPIALGFDLRTSAPHGPIGGTARTRRDKLAFAATLSLVLALGLTVVATLSQRNAEARQHYRNDVAALASVDPDGRFVNVGVAVEVEGVSPFRVRAKTPMRLMTAWHSNSPHDDAFRARIGLDGDLLEQLVVQDDVYLVVSPGAVPELTRTYAAERRMTVRFRELGELRGGKSVIYRVERVG